MFFRHLLAVSTALILSCGTSLSQDIFTVFTPVQNGTQAYLQYLTDHCHESLYVAVYTLTSEAVADKYIELANKGVDVHVIIDKRQYSALRSTRKLVARMRQAGIEVIPCSSPVKGAIMHLKMTIADGQYVEEGSWNYTPNADLQCNHLNFNREASLDRGQLYRAVWDYIYESQKKPHKN